MPFLKVFHETIETYMARKSLPVHISVCEFSSLRIVYIILIAYKLYFIILNIYLFIYLFKKIYYVKAKI